MCRIVSIKIRYTQNDNHSPNYFRVNSYVYSVCTISEQRNFESNLLGDVKWCVRYQQSFIHTNTLISCNNVVIWHTKIRMFT